MDDQEVAKRVNQALRMQIADLVVRSTELAVRLELATDEVVRLTPKKAEAEQDAA